MDHSSAEPLLIGTEIPLYNSKIKSIEKVSGTARVIHLENGTKVPILVSRLKSFVDTALRMKYAKPNDPATQPGARFQKMYEAKQLKHR